MDGPLIHRIDQNEVRINGDMISYFPKGFQETESIVELLKIFQKVHERHGQFFLLVDLNDAQGSTTKGRRMLVDSVLKRPPAAAAFYGGNVMVRTLNAMVVSAANILSGRSQNMARFTTREQAEEWLNAERARLSAQSS